MKVLSAIILIVIFCETVLKIPQTTQNINKAPHQSKNPKKHWEKEKLVYLSCVGNSTVSTFFCIFCFSSYFFINLFLWLKKLKVDYKEKSGISSIILISNTIYLTNSLKSWDWFNFGLYSWNPQKADLAIFLVLCFVSPTQYFPSDSLLLWNFCLRSKQWQWENAGITLRCIYPCRRIFCCRRKIKSLSPKLLIMFDKCMVYV